MDSHGLARRPLAAQLLRELRGDQQNRTFEASVMGHGQTSVSSNKSRRITQADADDVKILIEKCLQLHLNRHEVIEILSNHAKIEPTITNFLWQELEERNANFFKAYYTRLKLKQQIDLFNQLLEQQCHLMKQQAPPDVLLASMQNEIHHTPVNNLPMGYPLMPQPPVPSTGIPHIDSMGSMPSCHVVNGIPALGNFHAVQMNSGKENADDTALIIPSSGTKPEMNFSPASLAANNQFLYTASDNSGLTVDTPAIDSTFTSDTIDYGEFRLVDANIGKFNETLQPSAQIPLNCSLLGLTAGLPNLEADVGVPFQPSDLDVLFDSLEQNEIADNFLPGTARDPGSQLEDKWTS